MWYTLNLFLQPDELTTAWSWVLLGIACSQIVGGPIAAGKSSASDITLADNFAVAKYLQLP